MVLKIEHFGQVDRKYLESFEVSCWRRKKFSWSNRVINEEVLNTVKEERKILRTTKGVTRLKCRP